MTPYGSRTVYMQRSGSKILQEAYDSPYSILPGNTMMYLDLKECFWWTGMKKDIAEYVVIGDVCQRE